MRCTSGNGRQICRSVLKKPTDYFVMYQKPLKVTFFLGQNLQKARKEQHLTREELAEKVGISATFCANMDGMWEQNDECGYPWEIDGSTECQCRLSDG